MNRLTKRLVLLAFFAAGYLAAGRPPGGDVIRDRHDQLDL
jgi:hypothetical protein